MNGQRKVISISKTRLRLGQWIRPFALIFLVAVITSINRNFLGAFNISTLLEDIGLLIIISIGMTFVLMIGSIDLSVGAIISCSSVILARLLPIMGVFAFLISIGFGLLAGLVNGLIFTKVRIPSFITTLGTMSIFTSLALVISDATPLQVGSEVRGLVTWANNSFGVVPLITVLAAVMVFVFYIVQTRTKFGKYCYAIGANEKTANMSGVNVNGNKIIVFVLAGVCFAFAGIILTGRLSSGIPTVGTMYTLMSIAAVALGGTALSGGRGGVFHTVIGAALLIVITNGMIVIGVGVFWQQIVYGVIIIAALCTTSDRTNKNLIVK